MSTAKNDITASGQPTSYLTLPAVVSNCETPCNSRKLVSSRDDCTTAASSSNTEKSVTIALRVWCILFKAILQCLLPHCFVLHLVVSLVTSWREEQTILHNVNCSPKEHYCQDPS